MRAGTTPACTRQLALSHWRNSVKNTHLTCTDPPKREGRAGSQNLERIASTTNPQRSAQNASMRCNVSHKKSKGPWSHPTDHVRLRRRPLTALAGNLTLPKLHLATLIYEKTKDKFPWEHPMTFTVDKKHTNQRGLKGKGVETVIQGSWTLRPVIGICWCSIPSCKDFYSLKNNFTKPSKQTFSLHQAVSVTQLSPSALIELDSEVFQCLCFSPEEPA